MAEIEFQVRVAVLRAALERYDDKQLRQWVEGAVAFNEAKA